MARQREGVERYAEMTVAYFKAKYHDAMWFAEDANRILTFDVKFFRPDGIEQIARRKITIGHTHVESIFKDLVRSIDGYIVEHISSALNGADLSGRASQVQQQPYATSARVAPEPATPDYAEIVRGLTSMYQNQKQWIPPSLRGSQEEWGSNWWAPKVSP